MPSLAARHADLSRDMELSLRIVMTVDRGVSCAIPRLTVADVRGILRTKGCGTGPHGASSHAHGTAPELSVVPRSIELTRSDTSRAWSMPSSRAVPLLRVLKISIAVSERLSQRKDSDKDEQAHADNDRVLFNGDAPMLRESGLTQYGMP